MILKKILMIIILSVPAVLPTAKAQPTNFQATLSPKVGIGGTSSYGEFSQSNQLSLAIVNEYPISTNWIWIPGGTLSLAQSQFRQKLRLSRAEKKIDSVSAQSMQFGLQSGFWFPNVLPWDRWSLGLTVMSGLSQDSADISTNTESSSSHYSTNGGLGNWWASTLEIKQSFPNQRLSIGYGMYYAQQSLDLGNVRPQSSQSFQPGLGLTTQNAELNNENNTSLNSGKIKLSHWGLSLGISLHL